MSLVILRATKKKITGRIRAQKEPDACTWAFYKIHPFRPSFPLTRRKREAEGYEVGTRVKIRATELYLPFLLTNINVLSETGEKTNKRMTGTNFASNLRLPVSFRAFAFRKFEGLLGSTNSNKQVCSGQEK